MKTLFKIAGFTPFILIVFLNAMTDLGHKITLQNTIFKVYEGPELIALTAIVNALILLPFIFLFSPAGFISDKYPKPKVIKIASFLAIIVTSLILVSYIQGWFWIAFGLTFILAAQSAIYSPAKYGLIKEMVGNKYITQANAVVQAVTIFSILIGAVVYSVFFENLLPSNIELTTATIFEYIYPIGFILIGSSIFEFILALQLKETKEENKKMSFDVKEYTKGNYLKENLRIIKEKNVVWLSIIGLSILWGVSQLVVAVFGPHLKEALGITNTIVPQFLLSIAGFGMVFGALLAGKISKNYIELGLIPLGALGVSISLFILPSLESTTSMGLFMFAYGMFSGFFIVPLNALIQFATKEENLGKVLAGNNFFQNVVMFSFLTITAIFAYLHLSSDILLYLAAIIALMGTFYTIIELPQSMIRTVIKGMLGFKYNVTVCGLENIEEEKGVLLLGNHISFLDWAIIQLAYPKQIRFVIDKGFYDKWYLKPFLKFFKAIPISPRRSKEALKKVTEELNKGNTVALFPEGSISRNGHLGEFHKGFEIATREATNSIIVPFYLRGLWEGNFSRASKKLKSRNERDLSVFFGKKMPVTATAEEVKKAVFDLSIQSWEDYANGLPSIQEAWIKRAKERNNPICMADSTGVELNTDKFITGVFTIASILKKKLGKEQNIGLILPTSVAGSLGNLAVLSLGKTIVNINYSSGNKSIAHALEIAEVNKIVTSQTFLTKLKAKGFDLTDVLKDKELIMLEDIKEEISNADKLRTLIMVKTLPTSILELIYIKKSKREDTAAILFSSGSEGTPKGIELSHKNILGNIKQIITIMNPEDDDVIMGTLPIFHSFGLTVTTILPLVEGISVVSHPDPTDGFGIGKLVYKYEGTILLGTATFLRLYTKNRKLRPEMFDSLRLVVAGAEKLPKETQDEFRMKFGQNIYEGYGTTETTPAAAMNIPDVLQPDTWKVQKGHKEGSIGLPLPGSSIRIVDPETFEELPTGEAGMVIIGGTQIMKGYIKQPEKTKEVIKEIDGIRWYVTGDKGYIDKDGFVTLVDRYSRFAKIGGEMISLGLVEQEIRKLINQDDNIMATAIPDNKKGEKIVLLFNGVSKLKDIIQKIKESKLNPLFKPSTYHEVEELPKLGTGKADFKGAKNLAIELEK